MIGTKLRAAILAGVAVLAFAGAAQAQTKSHLNQILERGSLKVGTTGDFNPMSIRDPANNTFKGFEIDAAEQLAKDLPFFPYTITTNGYVYKSNVKGGVVYEYVIPRVDLLWFKK